MMVPFPSLRLNLSQTREELRALSAQLNSENAK
jgi:hypothetical protein